MHFCRYSQFLRLYR